LRWFGLNKPKKKTLYLSNKGEQSQQSRIPKSDFLTCQIWSKFLTLKFHELVQILTRFLFEANLRHDWKSNFDKKNHHSMIICGLEIHLKLIKLSTQKKIAAEWCFIKPAKNNKNHCFLKFLCKKYFIFYLKFSSIPPFFQSSFFRCSFEPRIS